MICLSRFNTLLTELYLLHFGCCGIATHSNQTNVQNLLPYLLVSIQTPKLPTYLILKFERFYVTT